MRFSKKKRQHFTKKTITDPQKLKLELEKIRKEGVAFTREEIDVGVNAIGAPILNYKNQPVGAVVIVGPCCRVKCNKRSPLVSVLKETVSAISAYIR
jgi:DNA-binding IclR family transcriptional regulator